MEHWHLSSSILSSAQLHHVVEILRAGGLILYPTETTYGAGVDATHPAAVAKLLAYKARREGKPLSIAVTDATMAAQYVEVNSQAKNLYERFLPGPVTVISKSLGQVAPGVASEFGTLGIRMPDYPMVMEIVGSLGKPMTATSANPSDGERPYDMEKLLATLSAKQRAAIDLIIDVGVLPQRPPSTVIDTTLSAPVVFRQGEVIAAETDQKIVELTSRSEAETKTIAQRVVLKHWNAVRKTGLVIGLDGSLGAGKTIFVKGVAEFLQIPQTITSPTYTYVEEYNFQRHQTQGKLFHLDVWKVSSVEEFMRLGFGEMIRPNQLVIIEWVSTVVDAVRKECEEQNAPFIHVTISPEGEKRQVQIAE